MVNHRENHEVLKSIDTQSMTPSFFFKDAIMILRRMGGADQQKIGETAYPSIWRRLCKAGFQQIPPLVLNIKLFSQ